MFNQQANSLTLICADSALQKSYATFADRLIDWQRQQGRHFLPWQNTHDVYAIWVSEIMLQQTQVSTVIPYYQRFMAVFPDVKTLADASLDTVLTLWSGLGYYSRGRNLHKTARIITEQYAGKFPQSAAALQQLPGIGRSTAAAIAAFAFGERCAILDGNVRRILARYRGINGYPGKKAVEQRLWQWAEKLLPIEKDHKTIATYTQALMDLGALICKRARPDCQQCPLKADCVAYQYDLTTALPTPKSTKALPVREIVHLVLINQGKILLEKRPTTGIWGGLWCFPELSADQNSQAYCEEMLQLKVHKFENIADLQHSFTHFKLIIHPRLGYIDTDQAVIQNKNWLWLMVEEAIQRAIPSPVRKLLKKVQPLSKTLCV